MVGMSSKLILLKTKVQGHLLELLIDSGASHNFLSLATCRRCGLDIKHSSATMVALEDGSLVNIFG